MEFLVRVQVDLPHDMATSERAALTAAERDRGLALRRAGTIVRIWRIPGRPANIGVWKAPDATALHEALASLPFFPYADIEVTALAVHPLEGHT